MQMVSNWTQKISKQIKENIKDVRAFIGLCSYYRRFIKGFSNIALPLNNLLKKDAGFEWQIEQQNSFELLKQSLTTSPILVFPDFNKPFIIYSDASGQASGYVLSQYQGDLEKVILYGGRNFTSTESKYSTTEREALAVVVAIQKCRPYVYGQKFKIVTDHNSLKWLISIKDPTGRLARWSLILQSYNFEIAYRSGKIHGNADGLSRCSYNTVATMTVPGKSIDHLVKEQRSDPYYARLVTYLTKRELPDDLKEAKKVLAMEGSYHLDENGLLFHHESKVSRNLTQLVVPQSLRSELITWAHDEPCGGHFGVTKTFGKIRRNYFWVGMYNEIQTWVKSCITCAQRKQNSAPSKAPLLPIPVEDPWDIIAADCLGPFLPSLKGNLYIFVFGCLFTKYVEAFAVSTIAATSIAELFVDNIVFRHGAPRRFLTDRGSNCTGKLIKVVCDILNVKKLFTTAYHPQTDGFVERINGVLAQNLSMYVASNQRDWDVHLPAAVYAYNTSISTSTGETPFRLTYGRDALQPHDTTLLPRNDPTDNTELLVQRLISDLRLSRNLAKENIQKAQTKMKLHYDQTAKEYPFQVGHKVWIYTPITKKGSVKKLTSFWHGPFRLIEKTSPVTFKVENMNNKELTTPVHVSRLKQWFGLEEKPTTEIALDIEVLNEATETSDEFCFEESNQKEKKQVTFATNKKETDKIQHSLPENEIDDLDIFKMEEIIGKRQRKGRTQYLVKWQDFPSTQNTWEPEENIFDKQVVQKYLEKTKKSLHVSAITRVFSIRQQDDKQTRNRLLPIFNINRSWNIMISIILLCLLIIPTLTTGLFIGEVYDCTKVQPIGVYQVPSILSCAHNMHSLNDSVKTFVADVYAYRPQTTTVILYHCYAEKVTLTCQSNFLNQKSREIDSKKVAVTQGECLSAMTTKISPYGALQVAGPNAWRTVVSDEFHCSWMRTKTADYMHFNMRIYEGQLTGRSLTIEQYVTKSPCYYVMRRCVPTEWPESVIVWESIKHDEEVMKKIGTYPIEQIGEFILIRSLKIGGAIQLSEQKDNVLTLDNGMILKDPTFPEDVFQQYKSAAANYSQKLGNDPATAILEAHISVALMSQKISMISAWEQMCFIQTEISRIHRRMITQFPTTSAEGIHQSSGVTVESAGDALLLSKCVNYTRYAINYARKIGNFCFEHFPITLPSSNITFFLEVSDRKLIRTSPRIPCKLRPKHTYLQDSRQNTMYEITAFGRVKIVGTQLDNVLPSKTKPVPRIRGYSKDILVDKPQRLSPYTVLQLISGSHETLQTLKTISDTNGGDILTAIGTALCSALQATASGGSQIIKAIGGAIKDSLSGVPNLDEKLVQSIGVASSTVLKAAGGAVKDVGEGAGSFFHKFLGGISGSILWAAILLIVIYLIVNKPNFNYALPCLKCFQKHLENEAMVQPRQDQSTSMSPKGKRHSTRTCKYPACKDVHRD
ncbi:uncharacterized protein LOC136088898 [Hydra vulgaris]|uniref:Uncharacterized protein LOC136088898 n=1 Tax=Hydra vulgaris TaxID=6087 RepID=A0ABM4D6X9_HYDVU